MLLHPMPPAGSAPLTEAEALSWARDAMDHLGEATSVGVETFVDHLGQRLLIITVF